MAQDVAEESCSESRFACGIRGRLESTVPGLASPHQPDLAMSRSAGLFKSRSRSSSVFPGRLGFERVSFEATETARPSLEDKRGGTGRTR